MRYRLRTLLIVLALGPPVLAGLWFVLVWLRSPAAAEWAPIWELALSAAVGGGAVLLGLLLAPRYRALNQNRKPVRVYVTKW
jgi:hypothetical protein